MDLFNLVEGYDKPADALSKIDCPVLVLGSQTDILFPIWQQKQLAEGLIQAGKTIITFCHAVFNRIFLGNANVTFFELNSIFGHDTFLLDVNGVSTALKVSEEWNCSQVCISIFQGFLEISALSIEQKAET
jgi:homoserine acetyltransferase